MLDDLPRYVDERYKPKKRKRISKRTWAYVDSDDEAFEKKDVYKVKTPTKSPRKTRAQRRKHAAVSPPALSAGSSNVSPPTSRRGANGEHGQSPSPLFRSSSAEISPKEEEEDGDKTLSRRQSDSSSNGSVKLTFRGKVLSVSEGSQSQAKQETDL